MQTGCIYIYIIYIYIHILFPFGWIVLGSVSEILVWVCVGPLLASCVCHVGYLVISCGFPMDFLWHGLGWGKAGSNCSNNILNEDTGDEYWQLLVIWKMGWEKGTLSSVRCLKLLPIDLQQIFSNDSPIVPSPVVQGCVWGGTGGNLMGLSVEVNLQAQGKGLGHLSRDPSRIFHETLARKRFTIQAPTWHS